MDLETLIFKVENSLIQLNRAKSTIRTYAYAIKLFVNFCKKSDVTKIDNTDLIKFAKSIFKGEIKKNATIKGYKFGINYAFNNILKLNLDISIIPTPNSIANQRDYFTKKEIALFLSIIPNLKHKTIFYLMYAIGAEINEVTKIKITDIDSKNKNLIIRDTKLAIKRNAYLPASLLNLLREYYIEYEPKKFLFEGVSKNSALSQRTIQNSFKINFDKTGINKILTTRCLKNTYVKHLTEDGIPLNSILENLKIKNPVTLKMFSEICFPIVKYNSSPLDSIIYEKDEFDFFDTTDLEYLLILVKDEEERDYLEEGIKCFKSNALRAGVIFLWNASIYTIRKKCYGVRLREVNEELAKIVSKHKQIKIIEDFEYVKDSDLLDLACNLGVMDKFKKEELKNNCLNLRNKCGHPSNYKPKTQKIKAFVEDIIGMLYKE